MRIIQTLKREFPDLHLYVYDKHQIWFGKTITAYKTYHLLGFDNIEKYFVIYKCRTYYVVDWKNLKDSIIVKFEEDYKIFQMLYDYFVINFSHARN